MALAIGCAQEHPSICPDLEAALAADAMIREHMCARRVACYRDGASIWRPQCEGAPAVDAFCEGLASGSVVFHPERLDACLAELTACEAGPCYQHLAPGTPTPTPARCGLYVCRTVFEGTPPLPCSGFVGINNCVATGECGGTLQPRGVVGARCGALLFCATGLQCGASGTCTDACTVDYQCPDNESAGEVGACVAGRCISAPPAAIAEPCVGDSSSGCAGTGVYCHRVTRRCTPQAAAGATCDRTGGYDACSSGLHCGPSGTCVSSAFCTVFEGCPPETPYCTGDGGTCTADVTMQACDGIFVWSSGYEWCSDGYACVDPHSSDLALNGRCLPIVPVGATCDATVTCTPGAACERGRCMPVVAHGSTCDASVACGELYACLDGRCRLDPDVNRPVGAACVGDAQCATGHCRGGLCAWLAVGEPCTLYGNDCQFGCNPTGSGVDRACASGTHAGIDGACTFSQGCDPGLTCLPRPDGTSVCRPLCPP